MSRPTLIAAPLAALLALVSLTACEARTGEEPQATAAAQDFPPNDVAAPSDAATVPAGEGEPTAAPEPGLAPDVARFVTRRDKCDHFRGEDAYDKERAAFLDAKLAETCNGTDAELAALRRKYRDDSKVIARLFNYDDRVE